MSEIFAQLLYFSYMGFIYNPFFFYFCPFFFRTDFKLIFNKIGVECDFLKS